MRRLIGAACLWLAAAVSVQAETVVQEITSPGGLKAWLVEEHSIPFTALEIRFQGGASLDAPGKRGAITLMAGLIEEGAGDLDAQGFAEARDALAAGLSFDVNGDSFEVSGRFLTENRAEGVALLKLALEAPRFDPDAIERVKGQIESIRQSDAQDPSDVAGDTFNAMAFGDHPYATDRKGTTEGMAALTRDDILAAKDRVMARDRVFVAAVGDITTEELGRIMDDLLGNLPAAGAPMPGPAPYDMSGGVTVVPFDTPQSVISFSAPGISRDDPDFFAAFVMNQILGGSGFAARLMEELREKRGLTYGVSTYLMGLDHSDTLYGSFASANEKAGEAIDVVRAEWARMASEGVTDAELEAAKTYLTGSYPLRFDGNATIANILVGMQMEGLTPDYIRTRNARVEAVTREDVARVAARLLGADALSFIVVGQPEGLVPAAN